MFSLLLQLVINRDGKHIENITSRASKRLRPSCDYLGLMKSVLFAAVFASHTNPTVGPLLS